MGGLAWKDLAPGSDFKCDNVWYCWSAWKRLWATDKVTIEPWSYAFIVTINNRVFIKHRDSAEKVKEVL